MIADSQTVKNPDVVGIEKILVYGGTDNFRREIPESDIADVDLISDNCIAIKTIDGYISYFTNCMYILIGKSSQCKFLREKFFPG